VYAYARVRSAKLCRCVLLRYLCDAGGEDFDLLRLFVAVLEAARQQVPLMPFFQIRHCTT
jgi:hypothetical protein